MLNRDVKKSIALIAIYIIVMPGMPGYPRTKSTRVHKSTAEKYIERNDSYENYITGSQREKKSKYTSISDSISNKKQSVIAKQNRSRKSSAQKYVLIKYKVQRGDTITKISKKFSVPSEQIISLNKISRARLKSGVILKIPSNKKSFRDKAIKSEQFSPASNSARPSFRWPLQHVENYKSDGDNGVKSIGIIISGTPGSVVVSSAPGIVKKIGHMRGYGKYIVIKHPGRYSTVYANLSQISVNEGDTIIAGNKIGNIPECEKKLHFQIDYEGRPENPLKYLPKNI